MDKTESILNFDKQTGKILGIKNNIDVPEVLVIPEEIDNVIVKSIEIKSFINCKNLKTIEFPKTLEEVRKIEISLFWGLLKFNLRLWR